MLTKIDLRALERLRALFLAPERTRADYWESSELVDSYDATFGQRIAWKWQAVLAELDHRTWKPRARTILDWGCGPGNASREFLRHHGVTPETELWVWDRSPKAMDYALRRAKEEFPALRCRVWDAATPPDLLLVSHVYNELSDPQRGQLIELARNVSAFIWVEAGTSEVSRGLAGVQEFFVGDAHHILGPCTHRKVCPLLQPENVRHWCHTFAPVPTVAFTDPDWVRFGKLMGIDLRSLPYSYLAVEKVKAPAPVVTDWSRVLGEPRQYKGFAKVQTCDGQHGVAEFILQKRDAPDLLKRLKHLREPPFFRFVRSGNKIVE
ncbi:MAG: methyltransferase domain-containing protein [Bdellovibrionales bacterium]|nr:methyltransferase domain-containing protein [Bdellovibrionales bacterium]